MELRSFVLLGAALCLVNAYKTNDPTLQGPYCGRNNVCCKDRQDICSHAIRDSLCYCDDFCKRDGIKHDDCCPDYEQVCEGAPAENTRKPTCTYAGKTYFENEYVTQDCNKCKCIIEYNDIGTWDCDTKECLLSDEVADGVNYRQNSWRAYKYPEFRNLTLEDALIYKLGTFDLKESTLRLYPVVPSKREDRPHFDARDEWGSYISPVMDQGWCGSDWAVAIATLVSDRFAIQSKGAKANLLGPQYILSCGKMDCRGGHLDVAMNFVQSHGLVHEHCFPYTASDSQQSPQTCKMVSRKCADKFQTGATYRSGNVIDTMSDIIESGPVLAVMEVYQDFFHYRDGVYRRSRLGNNQLRGWHTVRILGWGEDQGQPYWLAANSWGDKWGENGYFRIARGVNESDIERFIVAADAQVDEVTRK